MIGYWHHQFVRLSSVCLSVTLALCWLSGSVYRRLEQRVASRQGRFCPFRHYCCRMDGLATKRIRKNESKKTRTRVFLRQTDNQASTGCVTFCYSLTSRVLLWLVKFEWIEFGCVHMLYPLNRIVRQLVTETGSIVCQYVVDCAIGYHSNSWASCTISEVAANNDWSGTMMKSSHAGSSGTEQCSSMYSDLRRVS